MVEVDGIRLVIDAGPDFRYQMLREGVMSLDAILLTHQHKDHTAGIDDVRAFNFVHYPTIHTMHIYGNDPTIDRVMQEYDYAFAEDKYRGVPVIELHRFDEQRPFRIGTVEITPIVGHHSSRFRSVGFRFGQSTESGGPLAYITDFSDIDPEEEAKLRGVKVLVVNALRWEPHDSHFSVDEALALARRIAPERTLLTHMSHHIGLYDEAMKRLPAGVEFAYDGLQIEI